MTQDLRHKYTNKGAIRAQKISWCPFCQQRIYIMDWIVNSPEGWAHAACVNLKVHYNKGGGHPLCGTVWTNNTKTTTSISDVTCEKCIHKVATKTEDQK